MHATEEVLGANRQLVVCPAGREVRSRKEGFGCEDGVLGEGRVDELMAFRSITLSNSLVLVL